jgi:protein SCO1
MRDALLQAADGSPGGWRSRLAVLCAHLDPALGRNTGAVLTAMRVLSLASIALLAAFAWRQSRRRSGR